MTIRVFFSIVCVWGIIFSELRADDFPGTRRRNRFRKIIKISTKKVESTKEQTSLINQEEIEVSGPALELNQTEPFFMPDHEFTQLALSDDLIDYSLSFEENIELMLKRVEPFRVKLDDFHGRNREFCDENGYLNNDLKMITLLYFRVSRYKGEKRDYYTENGERIESPIRYSEWLLQTYKDLKLSIEQRAFDLALSGTESLKGELDHLQSQVNRSMYELELYAHVSKIHMKKKIEEVPSIEDGKPTGRAFWIGFYRKLSFYDYRFTIMDDEIHLFKAMEMRHGTQYSVGGSYIDLRDFKRSLESQKFTELISLDHKIFEKKFIITNYDLFTQKCESYNLLKKKELIELFNVKDMKVVRRVMVVPDSIAAEKKKFLKSSRCELIYSQRKFFKNRMQKKLCRFETRIYTFQDEDREVSLMNCP